MNEIMLLGGDGGLEYRLGQFGRTLTRVSSADVQEPDFDVRGVIDRDDAPGVLVLGPELSLERMLWIAASVDAMRLPTAIIAVAPVTPTVVHEAMRVGVRDVVDPQASDEELGSVLTWAAEHAQRRTTTMTGARRHADGRVFAVVAPKGGVGKSTIAVNLATELARTAPSQVVVVDLDLRFGDVATLLDLKPDHSIADVFASRGGLDTLLLKTFLTPHESGMWIVSAPDSPAAADQVQAGQVHQLLQVLSQEFRYVVVDTGSGLDEHTLAALEVATDALFVASMDVASLRNMRKELELLEAVGVMPARRHLVVNQADKRSGLKVQDVSVSVGLPIDAVVPRAAEIALSTNTGVPLLSRRKIKTPAAKALRKVVEVALRVPEVEDAGPVAQVTAEGQVTVSA